MQPSPSKVPAPGPTSGPAPLLCWSCGYDVSGVDLAGREYRCPECGESNIPGDPRLSPYEPRPWPHPAVLALALLWPGLTMGFAAILVMATHDPPLVILGGYVALLAFIVCIAWPLGLAELIVIGRVPGVRRARWLLALALGGIAGNLLLAATIVAAVNRLGIV